MSSFYSLRKRALLAVALLAPFMVLHASINTWVGGIGNWNTASNWSLNAVPGAGDSVIFNDGVANFSNTLSLAYLQMNGGRINGAGVSSNLEITGTFEFIGTGEHYLYSHVNNCVLTIAAGGTFLCQEDDTYFNGENLKIINFGLISIEGALLAFGADMGVENFGTIHASSTTAVVLIHDLKNFSVLSSQNSTFFHLSGLEHYGTINNIGGNGGTCYISGENCKIYNNSIISGFDTLWIGSYNPGNFIEANAVFTDIEVIEFNYAWYFEMNKVLPEDATVIFEGVYEFNLNVDLVNNQTLALMLENEIGGTGSITANGNFLSASSVINIPVTIGPDAAGFFCDYYGDPYTGIGDTFINNGSLLVYGAHFNVNSPYFENNGLLEFQNGGTFLTVGSYVTDLYVEPTDILFTGGTNFVNNGTLSICDANPMDVTLDLPVINNGLIKGTGGYFFPQGITNNGTTNPGCSPGHLHIYSDFDLGQSVNIELNGANPSQQDKLIVHGTLQAGTVLNVTMTPGTTLTAPVQILETSESMEGTFPTLNLPAGVWAQYHSNGITINPANLLMVNPGDIVLNENAGIETFYITTNLSNWTITDNVSWITINQTSGSGNGTATFSYTANPSTSSSRTGTITVKRGSRVQTINITQANASGNLCRRVSGVNVGQISLSSANISWNAVLGVHSYQLSYRPQSGGAWTSVNVFTNTRVLNNLLPGTTYQYRVRTRCGGGSFSDYTKTATFTTLPPNRPNATTTNDERNKFEESANEAISFTVFPNPVAETLFVEWTAEDEKIPATVTIYDLSGRAVFTMHGLPDERVSIPANRLPMGMSRLVIRDENGGILFEESIIR